MRYEVTMDELRETMCGCSDEQIEGFFAILSEVYILNHFGVEGATDSNKLAKIETSLNGHREALLKLLEDNYLSMEYPDLHQTLKQPIKISRMGQINTSKVKHYLPKLKELGFNSREIAREYLPILKRFIKNPEQNPLPNIGVHQNYP